MKLFIILSLISVNAFSLNYKKINLNSVDNYHAYLEDDDYVIEIEQSFKKIKNCPDRCAYEITPKANFDTVVVYNPKNKGQKCLNDFCKDKKINKFKVNDKLENFYSITLNNKKIWLHEDDLIEVYTYNTKNTDENTLFFIKIRKKIYSFMKEQPIVSLELPNILQAYNLVNFLELKTKEYYKTDCGIHCLMASVAMIWPEKLQSIIDNPNIVDDLISKSIDDNMTKLSKSIDIISCASTLAIGSLIPNPTEMPNIIVPLASGLGLNAIGPIGNTDKFLRNKIGMVPKKLQKLGNYCLETLELNENSNQMVLTEQVNFEEVLKDWHNILDKGSPIIVLIRATAFSGHFILIHSILDKDVYFWDQENFRMMSKEKLQELMDCHRTISLKTTSLLIGLNTPFVYLYFSKN